MSDTVDTLKQRVVGTFVIISLAVIFLPMIFDEPRVTQSNVIVPVPPRPAYKVIEIDKPREPKFQELVIDPESQKVVLKNEQVSASTTEASNSSPVDRNKAPEKIEQSTKDASAEPKVTASKSKNTPAVAHLPIFKNVWMVQLGTFSQSDNAYGLRDQLRKDGFDGHTKEIDLDGKPAIRVLTGPFVDKREAEKIQGQVDKKYNLKSQVIFFDA